MRSHCPESFLLREDACTCTLMVPDPQPCWQHHLGKRKLLLSAGIGGVHRGAESSLDISADLTELGRTQMIVVCAGIKSVLDIPRTLEYLETQGVCVAAVGTGKLFELQLSWCYPYDVNSYCVHCCRRISLLLQQKQWLQGAHHNRVCHRGCRADEE